MPHMELFKIVNLHDELKSWSPFLKTWHDLNERCVQHTDGNYSPFCYRERTNTGLLAAAAIKNDWVALEEYKVQKKDIDTRQKYDGRADLVLIHKIKSKKTLYEIEAKLVRKPISTNPDKRSLGFLGKAFNSARKNRENEDNDYTEHKVALTFIVPFIDPLKYPNDKPELFKIQNKLITTIDDISDRYEPDLLVYSFIKKGCELLVSKQQKRKYGYGTIIVGEIVNTFTR